MTASVMVPETTIDIDKIENMEEMKARFEAAFNQAISAEKENVVDSILRYELGHLKIASNENFRQQVLQTLQEDEALAEPEISDKE